MTVARSPAPHALAAYRDEFPIFRHQIYLNSCSLGALSRRSRERVTQFLDEWERRGAQAWYDVWWERLAALRAGYAMAIGADASEIALHASVSSATGVLASAIDYTRRPRVVTTELDFPTVAYQWLAKRPSGVEVVVVESPDGVTVPPDAIAQAVDDRTALVATSHVYFTTGAIQDIAAVSEVAHRAGAFCFIDAYQSVGQLPVDVHESRVDFLSAGGLKWLLGGPGITFLYVRDALGRTLEPQVTGWFGTAQQFAFDPHRLRFLHGARRFEQGTPSLAAVHAQLGGLEVIAGIGISRIRKVVSALTEDLIARAAEAGLRPRVAPDPAARSAIVMLPAAEPEAQIARLAERGVVADARPGHVRLSPFFYNVIDDHVTALQALRA